MDLSSNVLVRVTNGNEFRCCVCTNDEIFSDWRKHVSNLDHEAILKQFDLTFERRGNCVRCRSCLDYVSRVGAKAHAKLHLVAPWFKPADEYQLFFENSIVQFKKQFHCCLCDVTFDHWFLALNHLKEKSHRRLRERPSCGSSATTPAGQTYESLVLEGFVPRGFFMVDCKFCKVDGIPHTGIKDHIDGSFHYCRKLLFVPRYRKPVDAADSAKNPADEESSELKSQKSELRFFEKFSEGFFQCSVCVCLVSASDDRTRSHLAEVTHVDALKKYGCDDITLKPGDIFHCGSCDVSIPDHKCLRAHIKQESHAASVLGKTKKPEAGIAPISESVSKPISESVSKPIPETISETISRNKQIWIGKRITTISYCRLCNTELLNSAAVDLHVADEGHLAILKKHGCEFISPTFGDNFRCGCCDVSIPDHECLRAHIKQDSHAASMFGKAKKPEAGISSISESVSKPIPETISRNKLIWIDKRESTISYCRLCNTELLDFAAVDLHVAGEGHLANLKKFGCEFISSIFGSDFRCGCCDCKISGHHNVFLHSKGRRHDFSLIRVRRERREEADRKKNQETKSERPEWSRVVSAMANKISTLSEQLRGKYVANKPLGNRLFRPIDVGEIMCKICEAVVPGRLELHCHLAGHFSADFVAPRVDANNWRNVFAPAKNRGGQRKIGESGKILKTKFGTKEDGRSNDTRVNLLSTDARINEARINRLPGDARINETRMNRLPTDARINETRENLLSVDARSNETREKNLSAHAGSNGAKMNLLPSVTWINETKMNRLPSDVRSNETKINHLRSEARSNETKMNHLRSEARSNETKMKHLRSETKSTETKMNHLRSETKSTETKMKHLPSDARSNETKMNHLPSDARSNETNANHLPSDARIKETKVIHLPSDAKINGKKQPELSNPFTMHCSSDFGSDDDDEDEDLQPQLRQSSLRSFAKTLNSSRDDIYDMRDKLRDVELGTKFCVVVDPERIYCLICRRVVVNTLQNYFEHLRGLDHVEYLERMTQDHRLFEHAIGQFSELDLADQYLEETEDPQMLRCLVCDETVADDDSTVRDHIDETNHEMVRRELHDAAERNFQDTKSRLHCDWYNVHKYWCVPCSVDFATEANFTRHLDSRKHAIAKLQKENVDRELIYDFCAPCGLLLYGYRCSYAYHCDVTSHKWLVRDGHYVAPDLPDAAKELLAAPERYVEDAIVSLAEVAAVERDREETLTRDLVNAVRSKFFRAKAHVFGSRASGLGSPDSDVDVFLDCGNRYEGKGTSLVSVKQLMKDVRKCLSDDSRAWDVNELLTNCRSPIVRASHRATGLGCDISVENGLSVENTKLVKSFNDVFPACRKLTVFLKRWLALCNLSGSDRISSYALCWFVIFYLQRESILPSVAKLIAMNKKSRVIADWEVGVNPEFTYNAAAGNYSLKEFLVRFFTFYANFDFRHDVACPLLGEVIEKRAFANPRSLPKEMAPYVEYVGKSEDREPLRIDSPMCIQDPFDLQHNITKAVSKVFLSRFRTCCSKSLDLLCLP